MPTNPLTDRHALIVPDCSFVVPRIGPRASHTAQCLILSSRSASPFETWSGKLHRLTLDSVLKTRPQLCNPPASASWAVNIIDPCLQIQLTTKSSPLMPERIFPCASFQLAVIKHLPSKSNPNSTAHLHCPILTSLSPPCG